MSSKLTEKQSLIIWISAFVFFIALRMGLFNGILFPLFRVIDPLIQWFKGHFIIIYLLITVGVIIVGFFSFYLGCTGIFKGRMELFWKKGWGWSYDEKIHEKLDVAKGNYARFWGLIYIIIGFVFLGLAGMLIFFLY